MFGLNNSEEPIVPGPDVNSTNPVVDVVEPAVQSVSSILVISTKIIKSENGNECLSVSYSDGSIKNYIL